MTRSLVTLAFVLTVFGLAQAEPAFNVNEVVQQVHANQGISRSHAAGTDLVPAAPAGRQLPADEPGEEQSLLGSDFLIDTSSTLIPTPGSQTDPSVAFDGTNYLVVWQDRRSGNYSDICGTRVAPDGTVLDASGFVICQSPYDQRFPTLAFDGTNFLVVWDDYRRGHGYDIYGSRVSPAGTVLDPVGIIITMAANDQQRPDVAFDGAEFLVVWQDHRLGVDSPDVFGARVAPDGTVLDDSGIVICEAAGGQYTPAVRFGSGIYLVTWQDSRDSTMAHIYGSRVTPQGQVFDPDGFMISAILGTQAAPALAFNSDEFLVAWTDVRGSFPPELNIYGSRVTLSGEVLDPAGIGISTAGNVQAFPAVGADGDNFLVTWQDARGGGDIYGTRVAPDGSVLDDTAVGIAEAPAAQTSVALAFGGTTYLVVWQDTRSNLNQPDIYGTRVTSAVAVEDPEGILLTRSARDQYAPGVGFDGVNYLVVWEDRRSGEADIYGARVTPGGTVIDAAGFVITAAENDQRLPEVAYDGTNYLVVWEDCRNDVNGPDIYGARISTAGAVLDPGGISIAQATDKQRSPAVRFGGGNFLVAWGDLRGGGSDFNIYGARVAPDGTVLDPSGIVISQGTEAQSHAAIGFDGTNFLVVWEDFRNGTNTDIYGTRVTTGGSVLDPGGIAISQADGDQATPALAYDGTNYLVVWADFRRSVWPDIYGARVTTGGSVRDTGGLAISVSYKDQFGPAIAFNGTSYLVVWEDYRSSNNPDIYGAWVMPDGTVSDEGGVVRKTGTQTSLALVHGSGSRLFMGFQGWAGIVGGKTYNTDRVWGLLDPSTGSAVEETPDVELRMTDASTVVRGVLFLPSSMAGGQCVLTSIDGRKVMDLQPGANDVRSVAPGVYFIRGGGPAQKVIVQR